MKIIAINEGTDFHSLGKEILAAVEQGLDQASLEALQDFEKTTETWMDKPAFDVQKETGQRTIGTDSQIYSYINDGTAVRYATMTPDFEAKTEPRVLGARAGSGGVLFVSRRVPKPGIRAREFDDVIANKFEQGRLAEVVQEAINKA